MRFHFSESLRSYSQDGDGGGLVSFLQKFLNMTDMKFRKVLCLGNMFTSEILIYLTTMSPKLHNRFITFPHV